MVSTLLKRSRSRIVSVSVFVLLFALLDHFHRLPNCQVPTDEQTQLRSLAATHTLPHSTRSQMRPNDQVTRLSWQAFGELTADGLHLPMSSKIRTSKRIRICRSSRARLCPGRLPNGIEIRVRARSILEDHGTAGAASRDQTRSQKTKNLCSEFGTKPCSLLDRETYGVKKY